MIKLVHISTTNNERDLKFVNIPVTGSLYRNYTYNELNSPFLVAKKLTITFRILLIRGGITDTVGIANAMPLFHHSNNFFP